MKHLFFLVIICPPFTALCQTHTLSDGSKLVVADELISNAIPVNMNNPTEIQFAPGVHYKIVIIERRDATNRETVRIAKPDNPAPTTEKVDGEKAVFSSNWTLHGPTPAAGWYEGTIAFSNVPGSTASYTFTGNGIELWAERKTTHGSGVVTLLQGNTVIETKPVSFVGSDALPVKVYEKKGLPSGSYTVRLTAGTGYSLLDYFIVTK
jgi:hypothetical protein